MDWPVFERYPFDADHVPLPYFIDRLIGYFEDDKLTLMAKTLRLGGLDPTSKYRLANFDKDQMDALMKKGK